MTARTQFQRLRSCTSGRSQNACPVLVYTQNVENSGSALSGNRMNAHSGAVVPSGSRCDGKRRLSSCRRLGLPMPPGGVPGGGNDASSGESLANRRLVLLPSGVPAPRAESSVRRLAVRCNGGFSGGAACACTCSTY